MSDSSLFVESMASLCIRVGFGAIGYAIGSHIGNKVNKKAKRGKAAQKLGSFIGGFHFMFICMFPEIGITLFVVTPISEIINVDSYLLCETLSNNKARWSSKISLTLN